MASQQSGASTQTTLLGVVPTNPDVLADREVQLLHAPCVDHHLSRALGEPAIDEARRGSQNTKQTASALVDKRERAGHLERVPDPPTLGRDWCG